MSALCDYLLWQRKTTSVEGRRCIFSEHPASGHAPRYDLSDEQVIVEGRGDKEVKETVD